MKRNQTRKNITNKKISKRIALSKKNLRKKSMKRKASNDIYELLLENGYDEEDAQCIVDNDEYEILTSNNLFEDNTLDELFDMANCYSLDDYLDVEGLVDAIVDNMDNYYYMENGNILVL